MTVQVPEYGGCPWPIDPACLTEQWETMAEPVKVRAVALASSTLQRLTGGRVSNCPIIVRPCKPDAYHRQTHMIPIYGGSFTPALNHLGQWVNSCGCNTPCACDVSCEVKLPPPATRVEEVRVDGQVLPATDYRLDRNRLVYTGTGECPFPATQDLSLPDTEEGTFSVTYLNAYPVDSLGAYAAGVLAMEYAKACSGTKCRLPAGVTSVMRQGVTMEIASGAFPGGLTGIREVDSFIAMWNPGGLQRGSTVYSPDRPAPRLTTWGG